MFKRQLFLVIKGKWCEEDAEANQSLTPLRWLLFSSAAPLLRATVLYHVTCLTENFEEPNSPQKTAQAQTTFKVRYNLASMYISTPQWVRQILFHTKTV